MQMRERGVRESSEGGGGKRIEGERSESVLTQEHRVCKKMVSYPCSWLMIA